MIRIAMFSGPRNISTTMMRAFENRADTRVHDEPFYAWYLSTSGANHPMRDEILASQPNDWDAALEQLTGDADTPVSFEKHIAFHFQRGKPFDWLGDARVFQLIRDPRAMIASYANKYDDVRPIIDSFAVQREILKFCEAAGASCPIVDAADVLKAPREMLAALCAALDIEFDDAMLAWPAGRRDSDGVWGAHWYDAVEKSTGFNPFEDKAITLPADLEDVARACLDDYDFFHRRRLLA